MNNQNNVMDNGFATYNGQQHDPLNFSQQDPQLLALTKLPYVYVSPLIKQLTTAEPGISVLTGSGLIGKTTLLKQCIAELLTNGVPENGIGFFPCKKIGDVNELIELVKQQFSHGLSSTTQYMFIDDITDLRDWKKIIQLIIESGWSSKLVLILTSSENTLAEKIKHDFALQPTNKFKLLPLNFHDVIELKYPKKNLDSINLYAEFDQYLIHGGYLPSINDVAAYGKISDETIKMFINCVKGMMIKQNKQESFLQEVFTAIIQHYNQQITWNMLSKETFINHPSTIADYVSTLESLDLVFVQCALLEKKLIAAPKKARKLMFMDPFLFHCARAWIHPCINAYDLQIMPLIKEPELCANLAEACVITHYQRYYPTYYIKAEGCVDLAYLDAATFWPIVVTWTNRLRTKSLKQILKYANGKILNKNSNSGMIDHVRTEPLPQALWKLHK